jgi:hypothetical protein
MDFSKITFVFYTDKPKRTLAITEASILKIIFTQAVLPTSRVLQEQDRIHP